MRRPVILALSASAVLIAFAIATGCSNKSSSTQTGPGGGGGGTSAVISSGNIGPNGSFLFTFPDSGTTNYHCGVHPGVMRGNSVTVTSTSANDSMVVNIVSFSTPGFSPSATNIKPGGYVRWVNIDGMTHSVEND
jgi:plastocyanin